MYALAPETPRWRHRRISIAFPNASAKRETTSSPEPPKERLVEDHHVGVGGRVCGDGAERDERDAEMRRA